VFSNIIPQRQLTKGNSRELTIEITEKSRDGSTPGGALSSKATGGEDDPTNALFAVLLFSAVPVGACAQFAGLSVCAPSPVIFEFMAKPVTGSV
jgi:hypothetical protein